MNLVNKEKYTILSFNNLDINEIFQEIENSYQSLKDFNLILDISNKAKVNISDFKIFKDFVKKHKKNNLSFVIVVNDVDYNKIPSYLNVVPTKTEAIDIIEMEEIERDLGI